MTVYRTLGVSAVAVASLLSIASFVVGVGADRHSVDVDGVGHAECENTEGFFDGVGNDCLSNVGYDCLDMKVFIEMGYTMAEWQAVVDNCPASCDLCDRGRRKPLPKIMPATKAADPDSNQKQQALRLESDGSHGAPKNVTPAFRWAQNRNELLLEVKFAHKLDAPSCANAKVSGIKFGPYTMNMTGSGKDKLFKLDLHLFKEITPEVNLRSREKNQPEPTVVVHSCTSRGTNSRMREK